MRTITKKVQQAISISSHLSALTLICITILVSLGTLSRYTEIIGPWWMELSTILVVWLIYLNVSESVLQDEHIRVKYFRRRFSESRQETLETVTLGLNVVTVSILLVAATLALNNARGTTTPILGWSRTVLYAAFTIGMVTLLAAYGITLYANIRGEHTDGV